MPFLMFPGTQLLLALACTSYVGGKPGRFDCAYDCAYCPSEPGNAHFQTRGICLFQLTREIRQSLTSPISHLVCRHAAKLHQHRASSA